MGSITFRVPGRIGGWQRPTRIKIANGSIRSLTPKKTRATEAMVRELAEKAMNGAAPMDGPIRLEVIITLNHPKSWSKARKAASVYVTGRPDCDNICKGISDAANGILWRDDSQIAVIQFERRYGDGPEFIRVTAHDLSVAPFARPALNAPLFSGSAAA